MCDKNQDYIIHLKDTYPFEQRYINILTQIQDILEALDIMDFVNINTDLLGQAILDYFEDIDRLKKYEDIKKVNVDKIYSYQTYWLIKRKPIQITDNDIAKEYLHINEKVFTCLLIIKMLTETHKGFDDVNPKMSSFIELIYYNFKYRTYTQKTLELMVSSFICGCSFKISEASVDA